MCRIQMYDAFGDGWNGYQLVIGGVTITLNDGGLNADNTLADIFTDLVDNT